jgi:transglutaminase-like putative cysteine protease
MIVKKVINALYSRLVLSAFSMLVALPLHAENQLMLSNISLEAHEDFSLPFTDKITFEITSSNAEKIALNSKKWRDIEVQRLAQNRLAITLTQTPGYTGPVNAKYSKDSFVIDYQENATAQFIDEFKSKFEASYNLEDITAFVNDYIDEPTYVHGFNIASRVAEQKSGDCTEFAVLTTSLSRALGKPARFMTGTVILAEDGAPYAFGHAWTEVWHNEQWHIIDAALYDAALDEENSKRFYLPASSLENEGPGFTRSMFDSVGLLPEKITGLRNAD